MSVEIKPAVPARTDVVNIEVDGIAMEAPKGSMIIQATDKAGINIPRFCYHKKLSIAANCRMCLVDVEKSPKPMPACATPVMEGMKIFTQSRRAVDAQHGVMEFLLINHPLDCPICDQGGECELQDLAMGYGRSVSRFTENKRVVKDKNAGPLIQTDMTRCIHCTRCVRFLEEVAGTTEMGGSGRGDQLEIGTCVENSINSELSGNIIDLCPVGALTNKPFRFAARAWELEAKPSVGVHDGVGSLLYHHTRLGRILRSVPRDSESTNETWLSDRDRYSQAGLYAEDRVTQPMVRTGDAWNTVSWDEAIKLAAHLLISASEKPVGSICALMSPGAATEEYYLAQRLVRALGSANIDHRLREQDFSDDQARPASPEFAMKIVDMESADAVLLVGCNPRHEAPILGHRLRKAWLKGAVISTVNPLDWEFVFGTKNKLIAAPQFLVEELACVAMAVASASGKELPGQYLELTGRGAPEDRHTAVASSLLSAQNGLVMLGQFGMSHHQSAALRQLSEWIATASGCPLNLLPHGSNPVGAWLAGAIPHRTPAGRLNQPGLDKNGMLKTAGSTWLLWDFEPDFDVDNPAAMMAALNAAAAVIAVTAFASDGIKAVANVIFPLAPVAESEGSFFNLNGESVGFSPAGKVSGEARPGWKILRRLGDELGLEGFGQVNLKDLQTEMYAVFKSAAGMRHAETKHSWTGLSSSELAPGASLYRVGEVPIYSADALCRRTAALQETVLAQNQFIGLNPADAELLDLADHDLARVSQGEASVELAVRVSATVPKGAAWLRSATRATRALGAATGPVKVEAVK